jgi:hypothetical protein
MADITGSCLCGSIKLTLVGGFADNPGARALWSRRLAVRLANNFNVDSPSVPLSQLPYLLWLE